MQSRHTSLSVRFVLLHIATPAHAGSVDDRSIMSIMAGFKQRRRRSDGRGPTRRGPTGRWVIRLCCRHSIPRRRIGILDRATTVLYIHWYPSVPVSVLLFIQPIIIIISITPASGGVVVLVRMPRIGRWTNIPLISGCRMGSTTCTLVQHNVLIRPGLRIDGLVLCMIRSLSSAITP
jgi:hypothetical protein